MKCQTCHSCYRIMIVNNTKYYVCAFCKTVYDTNYNIILDKEIIEEIGRLRGWKLN